MPLSALERACTIAAFSFCSGSRECTIRSTAELIVTTAKSSVPPLTIAATKGDDEGRRRTGSCGSQVPGAAATPASSPPGPSDVASTLPIGAESSVALHPRRADRGSPHPARGASRGLKGLDDVVRRSRLQTTPARRPLGHVASRISGMSAILVPGGACRQTSIPFWPDIETSRTARSTPPRGGSRVRRCRRRAPRPRSRRARDAPPRARGCRGRRRRRGCGSWRARSDLLEQGEQHAVDVVAGERLGEDGVVRLTDVVGIKHRGGQRSCSGASTLGGAQRLDDPCGRSMSGSRTGRRSRASGRRGRSRRRARPAWSGAEASAFAAEALEVLAEENSRRSGSSSTTSALTI